MAYRHPALIWPLALAFVTLACNQGTATKNGTGGAEAGQPVVRTLADTGAGATITFEGIDVSHYQGTIDWTKVKAAGKMFAFAKATEGIDWVDPTFSTNWDAMKQAEVIRGAYHFFEAQDDAEAQAQHFIATVKLEPADMPPALDVEVADGQSAATIQAGVLTWLETIEAHYGVKPILYSDVSFLNEDLNQGLTDYPLWIAEYSDTPPTSLGGWAKWTFWQYSQSAKVDGIEGDVDVDKFTGAPRAWSGMMVPRP